MQKNSYLSSFLLVLFPVSIVDLTFSYLGFLGTFLSNGKIFGLVFGFMRLMSMFDDLQLLKIIIMVTNRYGFSISSVY